MVNSGPGLDTMLVTAESGTGSPSVVRHVKLADVLGLCAVLAFGLDIDLPLPAEAVEVVDEVAAHEGLEGLVDLSDVDALLEHLVAVHVHEELGHAGDEGGRDPLDLGPLAGRLDELVQVVGEEADALCRPGPRGRR